MDYDFTFMLRTDLPLTEAQVKHVRELIAFEISDRLGDGILNAPDEDEVQVPEVRLLDVQGVRVEQHIEDFKIKIFGD